MAELVPSPDWHPRVRRFFEWWRSLADRNRDGLPARRDIDPCAIPDLLPGTWMMDVQREPFRLRYRLIGTKVAEAVRRDFTGRWVDECRPAAREAPNYFERYRRVVEDGVPSWRKGPPHLEHDQLYVALENIVLPLAVDGRTVDTLVAHTVFYRADGREW